MEENMSMAKLRGVMAEQGYSAAKLAEEADMNVDTLRSKIRTGRFYLDEAKKISKILGIRNIDAIFFADMHT